MVVLHPGKPRVDRDSARGTAPGAIFVGGLFPGGAGAPGTSRETAKKPTAAFRGPKGEILDPVGAGREFPGDGDDRQAAQPEGEASWQVDNHVLARGRRGELRDDDV